MSPPNEPEPGSNQPLSTYDSLTKEEKYIYHANGHLIAEAYKRGGLEELDRILDLILNDAPEEPLSPPSKNATPQKKPRTNRHNKTALDDFRRCHEDPAGEYPPERLGEIFHQLSYDNYNKPKN